MVFSMRSEFRKKTETECLFVYYCILSFFYIYFYPFASYLTNVELDAELISGNSVRQVYFFYIYSIPIAILLGRYLLPIIVPVIPLETAKASNNGRVPKAFFLFQSLALVALSYIFTSTEINFSILFNRQNRGEGIFITQTWVIFVYFIQSVLFVSIYNWKSLSKFQKMSSILIFLMFLFLEVAGIGGRRYTLAIIIFYLYQSGILNYLMFAKIGRLLLISSIIAMIYFGTAREFIFHKASGGLLEQDFLTLMVSSNEFTEIGSGIAKSAIHSQSIDNLRMGSTLLEIPLYFIPRVILEEKPLSLSHQYDIPISVFSELFINFHILSLFFISLLSFLLHRISKKERENYFACLFAAYALDFIRADLATIIYTITFSVFFYYLMTRSIKNNISSL
jgi:hypothetical protein